MPINKKALRGRPTNNKRPTNKHFLSKPINTESGDESNSEMPKSSNSKKRLREEEALFEKFCYSFYKLFGKHELTKILLIFKNLTKYFFKFCKSFLKIFTD